MMRIFYFIFLFLVLCVGTVYADPTKIGAILPLTGKMANIGVDLRDAITLQASNQIEFVFEDDAFEPKNTVSAVQKLLADPNVKALISFGSGTSLAVKQIIERAKTPAIAIAMTDKIVENSKNIFRYYIPVSAQSQMIASEIERRGYKRVVLVASQQEAMLNFENIFRTTLNILPDGLIEVSLGDTDLRAIATKAIAMKPDGICLLLLPPELPAFARQVRQLGYQGDFFGPAQLSNPDAIKVADGALNGAWLTTADDSTAGIFYQKFEQTFHRRPTPEALNAYDSAGLLLAALNTPMPLEYLNNPSEYSGVFAKGLTLTAPNTFQPPLQIKVVKGKELEAAG